MEIPIVIAQTVEDERLDILTTFSLNYKIYFRSLQGFTNLKESTERHISQRL